MTHITSKSKIKLTKKESDRILKNIGKPKGKQIKEIRFHKAFDKGMQIALCLSCGYPYTFHGLLLPGCSGCGSKKQKVYLLKDFEKFIFKSQDLALDREKRYKAILKDLADIKTSMK